MTLRSRLGAIWDAVCAPEHPGPVDPHEEASMERGRRHDDDWPPVDTDRAAGGPAAFGLDRNPEPRRAADPDDDPGWDVVRREVAPWPPQASRNGVCWGQLEPPGSGRGAERDLDIEP